MDYTNPEFWIALGVGGSLVGAMSAGQQFMNKNSNQPYSEFRVRAVIRDFCLGAFLTAILYMFLPDSFHSMISFGQDTLTKIGGSVTEKVSKSVSFSDMELQTGPARF
jgi:hypothetical protein